MKTESYSVSGGLAEGSTFGRLGDLQRDLAPHGASNVKVTSGSGGWSYVVSFPALDVCTAGRAVIANLTYVTSVSPCLYGFRYGL